MLRSLHLIEVESIIAKKKRFALAADARTYHIQSVCSEIQMSQRLSTAVICLNYSSQSLTLS